MFGSWKRQADIERRVLVLEGELAAREKELRALRLEVVEVADKVYRWMKAAQARTRAEREREPQPPDPPVTPAAAAEAPRVLWGARARRLARARAAEVVEHEHTNGEG